jgi:hypothetical protein
VSAATPLSITDRDDKQQTRHMSKFEQDLFLSSSVANPGPLLFLPCPPLLGPVPPLLPSSLLAFSSSVLHSASFEGAPPWLSLSNQPLTQNLPFHHTKQNRNTRKTNDEKLSKKKHYLHTKTENRKKLKTPLKIEN